jgi:hypothetical protein
MFLKECMELHVAANYYHIPWCREATCSFHFLTCPF